MIYDDLPLSIYLDAVTCTDTPEEFKIEAVRLVKQILKEKLLKEINVNTLKEALIYANLRLLQQIASSPYQISLSALVIAKQTTNSQTELLIGGCGDVQVYARDAYQTELLFVDPFSLRTSKGLDTELRLAALQNALGRSSEIHPFTKRVLRTDLKEILILNYNESLDETISAAEVAPKTQNQTLYIVASAVVALMLSIAAIRMFPQNNALPALQQKILVDAPQNLSQKIELEEETLKIAALREEKEQLEKTLSSLKDIAPKSVEPRVHIVSGGESLSMISQKYYGTSTKWKDLYEANRDVLPSQHQIKAGMQLTIPP